MADYTECHFILLKSELHLSNYTECYFMSELHIANYTGCHFMLLKSELHIANYKGCYFMLLKSELHIANYTGCYLCCSSRNYICPTTQNVILWVILSKKKMLHQHMADYQPLYRYEHFNVHTCLWPISLQVSPSCNNQKKVMCQIKSQNKDSH